MGYVAFVVIIIYMILNLITFQLICCMVILIVIAGIGILSWFLYHSYLKPSEFDVDYKENSIYFWF